MLQAGPTARQQGIDVHHAPHPGLFGQFVERRPEQGRVHLAAEQRVQAFANAAHHHVVDLDAGVP